MYTPVTQWSGAVLQSTVSKGLEQTANKASAKARLEQNQKIERPNGAAPGPTCVARVRRNKNKQKHKRTKQQQHKPHRGPQKSIPPTHPPQSNRCCNTWVFNQSQEKLRRDNMSKFQETRKQWLARPGRSSLAEKYGLSSNQNTCKEETFDEKIRNNIEDGYKMNFPLETRDYEEMMRECHEWTIGKDKELSKKFWKRQLSTAFFKGNMPPCPILTALSM